MSGSPSAYLLWAILACVFQIFLIVHIWYYDRFQCIRWGAGRQPGAFKRVMTYSYLATVPLLVVFGVAMAVVKYKEGYYVTALGTVIPRPFLLWNHSNRRWILPLYFTLSFAWALEIVTHLEELAFWLFLLHQGPSKRNWFTSWEFRIWYLGSMVAILGMPMTTLIRRKVLETCQAWIFLAGSSAGLFTSVSFIYVLIRFPIFIRHVKTEGAEPDVVVRLSTFYHLNIIRTVFRFCFTVPLLVIGLDGVQGPHHIVSDPFWSDFLLMVGAIGCFISSALTLLIFFPRSFTHESGYNARNPSDAATPKLVGAAASPLPNYYQDPSSPKSVVDVTSCEVSPSLYHSSQMQSFHFPPNLNGTQQSLHRHQLSSHRRYFSEGEATPEYESDSESTLPTKVIASGGQMDDAEGDMTWEGDPHLQPLPRRQSRRLLTERDRPSPPTWRETDDTFVHGQHKSAPSRPTTHALQEEGGVSSTSDAVHPYILTFTSPIDLLDLPEDGVPRGIAV